MATTTVEQKIAKEGSGSDIPNKDTLDACQELKEGKGVSFTSLDELFKYLKN